MSGAVNIYINGPRGRAYQQGYRSRNLKPFKLDGLHLLFENRSSTLPSVFDYRLDVE